MDKNNSHENKTSIKEDVIRVYDIINKYSRWNSVFEKGEA